jgi:hypothetical protein
MALFTDGNPADIEYLRSYESGIQDVAASEGIDLDAKLTLAASEVGDELLAFISQQGSPDVQLRRRQTGLMAVVVTPSLRRWHATKTLELVYQDAYGSQLNERYATKLSQYSSAAEKGREVYYALGIGMVDWPVVKAGTPAASAAGPDALPYFAQVSWVGSTGAEGEVSDAITLNLEAGTVISAPRFPSEVAAAGWNLYAGATVDSISRQNAAMIAAGATWTFPGALTAGTAPGDGQKPDYFLVDRHGISRG